jgi:CheY-like chemotaxis protein
MENGWNHCGVLFDSGYVTVCGISSFFTGRLLVKVLIIDDSFHSRRYAQFMLQQLNCEVYTAESGEIGLEVVKNEMIDLIILDWNMPGLGGKKTLEELHQINHALEHPFKIVIYSGQLFTEITLPKDKSLDVAQFISKKLPPTKQFKYFQKCVQSQSKNKKSIRRSYAS